MFSVSHQGMSNSSGLKRIILSAHIYSRSFHSRELLIKREFTTCLQIASITLDRLFLTKKTKYFTTTLASRSKFHHPMRSLQRFSKLSPLMSPLLRMITTISIELKFKVNLAQPLSRLKPKVTTQNSSEIVLPFPRWNH